MASTGLVVCSGLAPLAFARPTAHSRRALLLKGPRAEQDDRRSRKGRQFENNSRRRGRPAWLRSPYDSPLRDGNRDRLIGLLTERAAKTLMVYLMETNPNVYHWLMAFYKANTIPKNGNWDDVSGETFLRKLLSMPIEEARFRTGRDAMYDFTAPCGVDPRNIAQRIMDIRSQLAAEFIQDLRSISEENSLLLRETLQGSLANALRDGGGSSIAAAAGSSGSGSSSSSTMPPTPNAGTSTPSSASSSAPASPPPGQQGSAVAPPRPQPPLQPPSKPSETPQSRPPASPADIVRALNAQMRAASASESADGGSGDGGSASPVSPDVLAQLRRALEASHGAQQGQHPELGSPGDEQQQEGHDDSGEAQK